MERKRLKVSVCMVTYNHEHFIRQAVESVLCQEVDFEYELVIGEDCSKDRTREILLSIAETNPQRVRLLLSKENLGANRNFLNTIQACGGELIACLDGDDYWTSTFKLQRQVDYLDAHQECVMVFSSALLKRGKEVEVWRPVASKSMFAVEDILQENFIPTCSVMCRNLYRGSLPSWINKAPFGDWPYNVLHALHGSIGYIDEPMAVYRVHSGGVWTSKSSVVKSRDMVAMAKLFSKHLPTSVSREPLKRLERENRIGIVYRCLVWGSEPYYGRRDALHLFAEGCWPFSKVRHFFVFLVIFFCPFLGGLFSRKVFKRL